MSALHAMLRFLETQRRQDEREVGHRPTGAAVCEVMDWLIAEVKPVADRTPVNATPTLSYLQNHAGEAAATLGFVGEALEELAGLWQSSEDSIHARRQPFIALIRRIESERYRVDTETFTTVTDGLDWSTAETTTDPAVRVQLDAERIARTEQAAVYQQRLQRMDAEIRNYEDRCAQRIRDLARRPRL
ncbi:hypothetical protein KIH27_08650 [Mycobacterium sp. M1]|uniref:Uncharacterized protein n=1 Tax=Mycolicibacter acidiphilus TaxID=2835306 RepID=A0ABS5RH72_9MYCO|nr:hypothetical protein [Mycolicibacter acidiphilus]MBS9533653.1 hypothetical protein [Mycolicibacter acidiphilus]